MAKQADQGNGPGFFARVWRSIIRGPVVPRDDRDRKWIVFNTLILHFRPLRVPVRTIRYTHTFGLGGMSLVLFLLLAATGLLLIFVYQPAPGLAYESIISLQDDVFFGKLVRNIHYWSANLLIVVLGLHLLRVYLTGAYHPPRQFNWIVGLALLLCVWLSNLTGYLLPWDQLSYWATTIVTGMVGYLPLVGAWLQGAIRGGPEIGAGALINFYAAHSTILPLLIVSLMALHFWRVRKARGVVMPLAPGEAPEAKPETVLALPNLFLREFAAAMLLIAFVMVLAFLFNAPLGPMANPGMSPNPAKAAWYFLGFQELQLHFHPLFSVLVLPLLATLGLLLIPYLRYPETTPGVFMMSLQGKRLGVAAALLAFILTPLLIVASELGLDVGAWLPSAPSAVGNGLLPGGLLLAALGLYYLVLRRKLGATRGEAVQSLFILLLVAFVVLTATGIWFRGAGMALTWPGGS